MGSPTLSANAFGGWGPKRERGGVWWGWESSWAPSQG